MNKKKTSVNFSMNIGTSSILLIFITLALVCFASLSLSSAVADRKLTDKALDKTTAYLEANNKAADILYNFDMQLKIYYEESSSEAEYFERVDSLGFETADDGSRISFEVSISDTQYLEVVLEALYPKNPGDGYYKVVSWKEYTVIDASEYEGTLTVFP